MGTRSQGCRNPGAMKAAIMFTPGMHKVAATLLAGAALACASISAQAQPAWPNRPIRMVVPVAAGGNVDLIARAIAEPLSRALGQTITVDNRPSAASLHCFAAFQSRCSSAERPSSHTTGLGRERRIKAA